MRNEAGYTLLELLVVLTIMAILISAVPGAVMPGVEFIRLSGTVEEVAAKFASAHDRAIETGRIVLVSMSALVPAPSPVRVVGTSTNIAFYPDGSTSRASVTLSYLGRQRSISVDSITGEVTSTSYHYP